MTKRTKTIAALDSEEGGRIAQALFGFMGKARLYNTGARAAAIRIIEMEAKTESDPVEKAYFEAAVAFIKQVDEQNTEATKAAYGRSLIA